MSLGKTIVQLDINRIRDGLHIWHQVWLQMVHGLRTAWHQVLNNSLAPLNMPQEIQLSCAMETIE